MGAFYVRRTLRIFPAYYAMVAATAAAHWFLRRPWSPAQLWTAVTYTVDFYVPAVDGLKHPTSHAWSLGIEEQFYLVWPGLLLLALRGGGGRRRVAVALGIVAAAAAALRVYLVLGRGAGLYAVGYGLLTRAGSLAIGCLLAVVLRTPAGRAPIERLGGSPLAPAAVIALLVAARALPGSAFRLTLGYTVDSLLCAALLVLLVLHHDSAGWRWTGWPLVRRVGLLSYSIYLWQSWSLALVERLPIGNAWVAAAAFVAGALVLAWLSYRYVERPFLRLKDAYGRAHPAGRRSESGPDGAVEGRQAA
jgi:peptidoglycan/LPS O-acetylase OafA/YrhL